MSTPGFLDSDVTSLLDEGQYELTSAALGDGGGFPFGIGTSIDVREITFGPADIASNDVGGARTDGVRFGRDYRRGGATTFVGQARDDPAPVVMDELEAFAAAWDAQDVRNSPGLTSYLRWCRGGRERWVFGRCRPFSWTTGYATQGVLPYTCQFVTGDHRFYGPEQSETIPLVPRNTGGLGPGPLVGPWIAASASGVAQSRVVNGGSLPCWLAYKIQGPIVAPQIEVTGQWFATLDVALGADQFVVIDPSPWIPYSVRRNDGAYLGGKFTAASQRLSGMQLPPGESQVLLRGLDPTGRASLTTYHRDTFASY